VDACEVLAAVMLLGSSVATAAGEMIDVRML
jgi:hypothetical protein